MKALILVGGYGTRLRPLTLSVPKPLISFCNKSIVEHQIEALVGAGVKHVVLAVAKRADTLTEALNHLETKLGITITCSVEETPLGTGGPIRLAEEHLMQPDDPLHPEGVLDESFFVFNSDVTCEYPLEDLKVFHHSHGREGTILVTQVDDPSKYGVVLSNEDGKIREFVEKPSQFVGNRINAGIYLLKKRVIQRIEQRPTSIEHETFPSMASADQLYCKDLIGYWADIGQPKDYLIGMKLFMNSLASHKGHCSDDCLKLAEGPGIMGNVIIDPTASIGQNCHIGPNVTIARGCRIGDGVRIKDCAIMDLVRIDSYAWINQSIVGWQSSIGKWARIDGLTVVGEDVHIKDECFINGVFILPHKVINSSLTEPGAIIM